MLDGQSLFRLSSSNMSRADGKLVLELKEQSESELRGGVQRFKPEEAAILALLRGRLAKEAERPAAKKTAREGRVAVTRRSS
jgi:hypothetical protein